VARTLASLVFIKSDFFPLVVNRDDREKYIDALEKADEGDLSIAIQLFARIQKRALTKAIGGAVDIRPVATVEEALAATRDMLVGLGRIIPKEYLAAKQTAGVLANQATGRLNQVAITLSTDITQVDPGFVFQTVQLGVPLENELRLIAEKLRYDPNGKEFHDSRALMLRAAGVKTMIVVSFHGLGAAFRGLLAAAAYFQVDGGSPVALSDDIFRISYQEPQAEAVKRFAKWLDDCLIQGLAQWRRTLV
jgi:hypothetical protein